MLDITPTTHAVSYGSIDVLDLLLERGADVGKGQLLHEAMRRAPSYGDVEPFVLKLLNLGCPINEVKYQNDPVSYNDRLIFGLGAPIHHAAEFRSLSLVRFLLENGADPFILDSSRVTACYWAEKRGGREDVVVLLTGKEWESKFQSGEVTSNFKP
jgi:ankyrin repeat protein